MLRFECDYLEGADARVLAALCDTNASQTVGYGVDDICEEARAQIRALCAAPDADVHFFTGGTQVNATVIAAALRPFEGALCADTGHINVHETGAVEATGHKVLALPGVDGKITARQVCEAWHAHIEDGTHEHMVRPSMVYISYPTELGTLYTRAELEALFAATQECGLRLYIDGARLGYGLAAQPEVDLPFLASHSDAFTIGGTKCGALFGEALVLRQPEDWDCFRYHLKQRGAMLAKGRLLGVQFRALMADNHYVEICRAGNERARRIEQAFREIGVKMLVESPTNQIFPVLPNDLMERLAANFSFSHWAKVDETHTAVRFCGSATTADANVDALVQAIQG